MVKLRNISKNGKLMEADFYPENKELFGHIVMDIETESVISVERPSNDYGHFSHARTGLREAIRIFKNSGEIPKERTIMWY